MFTFSFSSAFAAPTADEYNKYYQNVDLAEQQVISKLDTAYRTALNGIKADLSVADGTYSMAVSADAQKAAMEVWHADAVKKIQDQTKVVKGNCTDANKADTAAQIAGQYDTVYNTIIADPNTFSVASVLTTADYAKVAAVKEFEVRKAELLRQISLIDTDYDTTTTEIEIAGEKVNTTYAKLAADEVARLKVEIEKISLASDASVKEAVEAVVEQNNVKAAWEATKDEDGNTVYKFKNDMINVDGDAAKTVTLLTKEQVENAGLKLEANKASLISGINAMSNELYLAHVNAKIEDKNFTADKYADAEAVRNAFVTLYTARVQNAKQADLAKILTDLQSLQSEGLDKTWYTRHGNYAKNIGIINELEAFAAKYKAEKDVYGNLVRDAEAVDKVVENAKKAIYAAPGVLYKNLDADKTTIEKNCYAGNSDLDFAKKARTAQLEKAKEEALKNYYEPEQAKVTEAFDKAIAKVAAAKTVSEANVATPALTGIKTKNDVQRSIAGYVQNETAQGGPIDAYITYLNAGKKDADKITAPSQTEWQKFYAEKGARTEKEVKALLNEAKAKVDSLKTASALDADRTAIEDMIKALPSTITLADKDAVKAAWDALQAYEGTTNPYNKGVLDAAVGTLASLEKKALEKEIKELPYANLVTLADKAAVKAVAEKVEAYNELVARGSEDMYEGRAAVDTTKVDQLTKKIMEMEADAVKDAINKLPLNITAADREAVKAARALYDAYVAEYTDLLKGKDATKDITNRSELFDAEDAIAVIDAEAVEALKITASSKATKGAMTITWKVKGEKNAAKGYQVWRSTKKNSGFKKMITTSKMSYKNTKGLKKGVTYYYKVRAYGRSTDGKLIFSDWSNKAYRKAK